MRPLKGCLGLIVCLFFTWSACSDSGSNDSSKSDLTIQQLQPTLEVYQPSALIAVVTNQDCSNCTLVMNGIDTPIIDFMLSSDLTEGQDDALLATAKQTNQNKYPILQLPAKPCGSALGASCNVEILVKKGNAQTKPLVIKATNELLVCLANQELVEGKCVPTQGCQSDSECVTKHGTGWSCLENQCKAPEDPCALIHCTDEATCQDGQCIPDDKAECQNDSDCADGAECSNTKKCVKKVKPFTCSNNSDCGPNGLCDQGICRQQCSKNADCDAAKKELCHTGSCLAQECLEDSHCGNGKSCVLGKCLEQKGEEKGVACDSQSDCIPGEICINKHCVEKISCSVENTNPTTGNNSDCPESRKYCLGFICINDEEADAFFDNVLNLTPDKKNLGEKCTEDSQCASGYCVLKNGSKTCADPSDDYCEALGEACGKGKICDPGLKKCITQVDCTSHNECKQGQKCSVVGFFGPGACLSKEYYDASPTGKQEKALLDAQKKALEEAANQRHLTYGKFIGYNGGTEMTHLCAPGSALTAMNTKAGSVIDAIRFGCTPIQAIVGKSSSIDWLIKDNQNKDPLIAGGQGGDAWVLDRAPSQTAFMGIWLKYCNDWISICEISLASQPVTQNNSLQYEMKYAANYPMGTMTPSRGKGDGDVSANEIPCPTNHVLVGFKTKSGSYLNAIQPICQNLSNINAGTNKE